MSALKGHGDVDIVREAHAQPRLFAGSCSPSKVKSGLRRPLLAHHRPARIVVKGAPDQYLRSVAVRA